LQLIRPALAGKRRRESREQEVSEISRSLKAMAKELKIPVIALSQLNRQVEHREDKRPRLSDLRESGAIEQDADVILFVHRPGLYNAPVEKTPPGKKVNYAPYKDRGDKDKGEEEAGQDDTDDSYCELIVGKQRNGPTGIVEINFFKEWACFKSREMRYDKEQIPELS